MKCSKLNSYFYKRLLLWTRHYEKCIGILGKLNFLSLVMLKYT